MKGLSCINKKNTVHWYARIGGVKKYCGIGEKGKKIAIAAKRKEIAKKYEYREVGVGLKTKKLAFKNVTQMSNWYMTLPHIQE
jgi:uncharacterized protein YneR